MNAISVLVTGASGQVGRDLVDVLNGRTPPGGDAAFRPDGLEVHAGEFDVAAFARVDLDVTDARATQRVLESTSPDVVVNLAAYTAVDRAQGDVASCEQVNRDAVATLSQQCRQLGSHFVTISTDYVFDGTKGSPYTELDATNPLNVYGSSKLAGEAACDSRDSIVRTSWVMGVRGANVANLVAERVRRGETVRFVDDQLGTPTSSADLARALVTIVRERPRGLWHVANSGVASWFDVASHVARCVVGSVELVQAIATSDLTPTPAAVRPPRSDLATDKWCDQGWLALPPWSSAISRLLADR
jgi:dTDP-4-dehydrorhamnose reductase